MWTAFTHEIDGQMVEIYTALMRNLSKRVFQKFSHKLLESYCSLIVEGKQNLPVDPSYMIVSNHRSHIDTVALMVAAQRGFDSVGMVAAADYFFDRPHPARFCLDLIPIQRKSTSTQQALENFIDRWRRFDPHNSKAMIIYPEGTRNTQKDLMRFRSGFIYIANYLDKVIVPACVLGGETSLPKNSIILRPGELLVRFGQPIDTRRFLSDASHTLLAPKAEQFLLNHITDTVSQLTKMPI